MPRSLVVLLAFVAGWVDASSFVGLDNVMAAHITGNLVVLANDLARGFTVQDSVKVIILPIFFLGVMLVTVLHDRVFFVSSREALGRRVDDARRRMHMFACADAAEERYQYVRHTCHTVVPNLGVS